MWRSIVPTMLVHVSESIMKEVGALSYGMMVNIYFLHFVHAIAVYD